jgi:hypothetical protein
MALPETATAYYTHGSAVNAVSLSWITKVCTVIESAATDAVPMSTCLLASVDLVCEAILRRQ